MENVRTFADSTAADNKLVGFDYQYYYFFDQLLSLRYSGEKIGMEVKDDVHIEIRDELELIQLKHSVRTKDNGEIINLKQRDVDIWKTIHNWINLINDSQEGRESTSAQEAFLKKTKFVLVSNKSVSKRNKLLEKVSQLQSNEIDITEFRNYLVELSNGTKPPAEDEENIKTYIDELCNQQDNWIKLFVERLQFDLGVDDLIERIKCSIKGNYVPDNGVDDVFHAINSRLRNEIYTMIKKREKVIFTFDDFHQKYTPYFCQGRTNKLPVRRIDTFFNGSVQDQNFIKQLIEVGDIDAADIDEMREYTSIMLHTKRNIENWCRNFEITPEKKEDLWNNSVLEWRNTFKESHFDTKELFLNKDPEYEKTNLKNARSCLFQVRKIRLSFGEDGVFDVKFSNGKFYLLSDQLCIGWLYDWKQRYVGNE